MGVTQDLGGSPVTAASRSEAWDRWAFATCVAAWALSMLSTCIFVALYSSPIPAMDDMELVWLVDPQVHVDWRFMWAQANEHRIALPRLVYCVLLALTQKGVSREDAYRLVQRNAMKAWRDEGEFLALLKADPDVRKHLSEKELTANFDLDFHLAQVDAIFARVFGRS